MLRLMAEGALSLIGVRTLEEPAFRVVDTLAPDLEIRAYGPRLAAETAVEGMPDPAARREGFRRLARYIFGANRAGRAIAMTAPVATAGPARPEGRRIPMTMPVGAAAQGAGGLVMRFFLPAAITPDAAPAPADPLVRLVLHPGQLVAALRWSGPGRPAAAHQAEARLAPRLSRSRWEPDGPTETWFYDPPSTPSFLRRNEAVVPVKRRG